MRRYIYPEIEITETVKGITLRTTLRKKHRGKWYFWNFYEVSNFSSNFCENKMKAINSFHIHIYKTIIIGKISKSLVNLMGDPFFKEDPNQISENDRLTNIQP